MAFISMLVCEWLGKQHDLLFRPAVAGQPLDQRGFTGGGKPTMSTVTSANFFLPS